jgi:hypothetical protein
MVSEVTEIESGKRNDRPALAKALARCRVHGATLVIAKLDRLARNVNFISSLMEAGVEFTAVDFPLANRLTIHILAAVAEHEAVVISARTKAPLALPRLAVHGWAIQPRSSVVELSRGRRQVSRYAKPKLPSGLLLCYRWFAIYKQAELGLCGRLRPFLTRVEYQLREGESGLPSRSGACLLAKRVPYRLGRQGCQISGGGEFGRSEGPARSGMVHLSASHSPITCKTASLWACAPLFNANIPAVTL